MPAYTAATDGVRVFTNTPSGSWTTPSNAIVSADNIRETFDISNALAQLRPERDKFFTYLRMLGRDPVSETIWKGLEWREQWQRRRMDARYVASSTIASGWVGTDPSGQPVIEFRCDYDRYGKKSSSNTYSPIFIVPGAMLQIGDYIYHISADATIEYVEGTAAGKTPGATASGYAAVLASDVTQRYHSGVGTVYAVTNYTSWTNALVIGSQWGEATGAPDGWRDEFAPTEFYQQIFKTAVPLMSGSAQTTQYRGIANEWNRIWGQHLLAHKMDKENAFLFNQGFLTDRDNRASWGIIPFIRLNGGTIVQLQYASSGYDDMVDAMAEIFDYETGNSGTKLQLASRSIIKWLSKIGQDGHNSFLLNSVGASAYKLDINTVPSNFGPFKVMEVSTPFGMLAFVEHYLLRGPNENVAPGIDLTNIKYRPKVGNGISRDDFVTTNVQDNDIDGRKDMITTECGLHIDFAETHHILDFS